MNAQKIESTQFKFLGETVQFEIGQYQNGRTALQVISTSGEPYGVLSVNLPDVAIPDGCIAVKNWSENEPLAESAYNTGLFKNTGVRAQTGFCAAPIWQVL